MKLNLRNRTYLVFGSVLFLSAITAFTGYYCIHLTSEYNDYDDAFNTIEKNILEARKFEKDFIAQESKNFKFLNGDAESVLFRALKNNIDSAEVLLVDLKTNSISEDLAIVDSLSFIQNGLVNYNELLDSLRSLYVERGFKSLGIIGDLRSAIHKVEDIDLAYDKTYMLSLRRREKDFFLRLDKKYLDKFDQDMNSFVNYLNSQKSLFALDTMNTQSVLKVDEMLNYLAEYRSSFAEAVRINEVIGFNNEEGIQGEILKNIDGLEVLFEKLNKRVRNEMEEKKSKIITIFWFLFIFQLLIAAFVAIKFGNRIVQVVSRIKKSMDQLSNGEFPEDLQVKTNDELEDMANATNDLRDRVRTAAEFSKEIGSGNLGIQYDDRYANDVLAKAIIEMREKLKTTSEEERKRGWKTEGIAKFSVILQKEKDDLAELCNILVSEICAYLNLNLAGIFVVNDEQDPFLELKGAYAYDRVKYLDRRIEKGEGLVGQCWIEEKSIFLTEVPDDYMNITSGLVEAQPKCIVILPLIFNNEVLGVMELAGFDVLEDFELEFLNELVTNVAATLSSAKVASRTRLLLEESKSMQESLQAQEEEMRQNLEEMQATQDMMDEKEKGYLNRVKELEKQVRLLNEGN